MKLESTFKFMPANRVTSNASLWESFPPFSGSSFGFGFFGAAALGEAADGLFGIGIVLTTEVVAGWPESNFGFLAACVLAGG
jgi:hypothetical protein